MLNRANVSIVIPLFNEEGNITVLADEIESALNPSGLNYECIWVDDGSTDSSWSEILNLKEKHLGVKLVRNQGQATAIMAGIESARFETIVTMDADLQNDPMDIVRLLDNLTKDYDVVCGVRKNRKDSLLSRKIPSKVANVVAQRITGVPVTDLGCTLRAFRANLVLHNRIIGEMHRLLVVHFFLEGARITEIEVNHRARLHGKSKYGIERLFKFLADLILATTLNYIMRKPLYLLGSMSLISFTLGLISALSAISLRVLGMKDYLDTSLITGSMILVSTSLILISIGLLFELTIRQMFSSGTKTQYKILAKKP